jgi:hypothetical protein
MARVPLLLSVALGVLAAAGPVGAQPGRPGLAPRTGPAPGIRPAPVILLPPGEPEVDDPRPFLAGKLTPSKDVDPEVLKKLMDKLRQMPRDEQPDKAQIEKMLNENPAFKDPKFLEQLEKLLRDPDFPKNMEGKLPKDVAVPDKEQGAQLADRLKDVIESGKQGGNPGDPNGMTPPKFDPNVPDPAKGPETRNPYADNEWIKWMEKNFGDSPAAEDAVKDLVNSLQKGDMKGMFDDIPELKNGGWKDVADWGKSNGMDLSKVKPPDINTGKGGSSWNSGGGGGSSWGSGGGGGGSMGGGGGVGLGGGGPALIVIAGIAGALFLALLLFRRWKFDQARRMAQGAGGPGGIDFDAIRTREELVQAFDHVSLDQIGEEARSWNHRVIADQFAEVKPAQAAPATELAGLYERARYAPLDEDLTAGDFADARRDLRAIAGGPA